MNFKSKYASTLLLIYLIFILSLLSLKDKALGLIPLRFKLITYIIKAKLYISL